MRTMLALAVAVSLLSALSADEVAVSSDAVSVINGIVADTNATVGKVEDKPSKPSLLDRLTWTVVGIGVAYIGVSDWRENTVPSYFGGLPYIVAGGCVIFFSWK